MSYQIKIKYDLNTYVIEFTERTFVVNGINKLIPNKSVLYSYDKWVETVKGKQIPHHDIITALKSHNVTELNSDIIYNWPSQITFGF
jgi:hypothetical protein